MVSTASLRYKRIGLRFAFALLSFEERIRRQFPPKFAELDGEHGHECSYDADLIYPQP